ncbi:hypothetical protein L3Q82_014302 [Scortum barcoo]|uniref:Uncharacterized protein n=1 Tax=Scortum barcoo TaxID=214431 RepID=A0ACB8VWJ2_9TELE|nr:hypothetical protein L3Q82_014302 [Scortum barcoo]
MTYKGRKHKNRKVTGQTKSGSQAHHEQKNIKDRYMSPGFGVTRAPPWSQAWGWGSQVSAWWPGLCPRDPAGLSPKWRTWARLPVGSPPRRKVHEGPVQCGLGSSRGGGPRRPNPWTKTLAIGTWNVTSLGGKEPELVREVERYRLEIVGLTSTHSLGSGTQLLERGWTLHYSGVAQGERRRAGVGLLIAPQLSRHVLEFTPVSTRGSLPCAFGLGIGLLLLFVPTGRTAVQSTRPSWSPWEGYLIVLRLGTPLFYWGTSTLIAQGNNSDTWMHVAPGHTLGRRSMIDFVVVSSDLRPYVLDTRVKRGAELSTDHHLVVSWIRWQRRKLDRPGRPKRIVRVCWERLAEPSVREVFNSHLRKSFSQIPREAGDIESEWTMFSASIVDAGSFEVVDARSLVPVVVVATPEPGGGHRKPSKPAARTVLEAKTRVWEEFGEAMEEDYRSASKRFWQTVRRLRRGKQYSANTVYSAGGELLTSTGDIVETVEEILRGSPQSHRLAFQ